MSRDDGPGRGALAQGRTPRPPAHAWTWLQRTRPVVTELARRLTGGPPPPDFVEQLAQRFATDPFVRDVVVDVVAEVAFRGRVPDRRPPGATWDRGMVWWAALLSGRTVADLERPAAEPGTQQRLFGADEPGGPAGATSAAGPGDAAGATPAAGPGDPATAPSPADRQDRPPPADRAPSTAADPASRPPAGPRSATAAHVAARLRELVDRADGGTVPVEAVQALLDELGAQPPDPR